MDKLQQVRDFLEATVKEKGLSLNSLSLKLGKNPTYLFHFVKRHSPKRLDETTRRNLAKILDVEEQSLCDFQLPNNLFQDKLSSLSNMLNFAKDKTADMISLDVLDMSGPHRGGFEALKDNLVGQELLSKEVFALYSSSNPKNIKILKAAGEAMTPTLAPGDMLWLDTSYRTISSDGIYLLNTSDDVLIRRVQTNPFDGSLEILPDNKTYKAFRLENASSLRVCGRVVFVSKKLA